MIKQFIIKKNTIESKNPKAPTHVLIAKVKDEWVNIGSGWSKQNEKGDKYLSCALQNVWVDHTDRTKSRVGFAIANEKDIMTDEPENVPVSPKTAEIDEF